ncbi:MAG: ABC transporter permease [Bacteroidetes bacterium]|nr:ABC transporter permease [Bacteroidota bacterium]MCL5737388.1 ABC transporter permease [Bacteroidota bacterium]
MISQIFSLAFLAQTIRITVPYALASLGGVYSERGGVTNIALEGIILNGAFSATVGTYYTGNPLIGVLCGIAGGLLTALIHAVVSINIKADQIISGIAINLFAVGITKFVLEILFHSSSNSDRIPGLPHIKLGFIEQSPDIARLFGNPLVLFTILIIVASQFIIFKTRFGLRLRAVGENPEAADTVGISVTLYRYYGVLISGALAGLAGTWLAFDQHSFTDGMSAGRGYIALAAMIVGKWNPLGAAAACLLFGFAESLQIQLQGAGLPTQFIQMIPYVVTIIVLAGFIGKAVAPAADGVPYEKEK